MKDLKIMAVCGFGVGSSMLLKMKIDEVLKANGMKAEVFTADVATAASTECDLIFTSKEMHEQLEGEVSVPVIQIDNFMNKKEIEEKGLNIIQQLLG
ncbi:PTS sugar transporter subunit IIB [Haloimpatiens sp. FM7330]|uniref:PTS sugar transporter subunit IIB n=1 Tax=Haloimpatiens sp. FM7330 TaxID=3298610 RepID=UPI0036379416